MSEPVKKRAYEAGRRHAASAPTRQRIVDAARELILLRGYRATTISAVAERADVNVDTVYELIGRKPVLLRELIEQAISGQDHGVVAEEQAPIVAIREEPDPAVKLAMYARVISDTRAVNAVVPRVARRSDDQTRSDGGMAGDQRSASGQHAQARARDGRPW